MSMRPSSRQKRQEIPSNSSLEMQKEILINFVNNWEGGKFHEKCLMVAKMCQNAKQCEDAVNRLGHDLKPNALAALPELTPLELHKEIIKSRAQLQERSKRGIGMVGSFLLNPALLGAAFLSIAAVIVLPKLVQITNNILGERPRYKRSLTDREEILKLINEATVDEIIRATKEAAAYYDKTHKTDNGTKSIELMSPGLMRVKLNTGVRSLNDEELSVLIKALRGDRGSRTKRFASLLKIVPTLVKLFTVLISSFLAGFGIRLWIWTEKDAAFFLRRR